MHAGGVGGVPLGEHVAPGARLANRGEVAAHQLVLRVKLRVFDAELAHRGDAVLGAVELLGQAVVLGDHVALLVERGRRGSGWPAARARA